MGRTEETIEVADLDDEEYELDEVENLMYSQEPTPRIFILSNANETALLGILESETEDSFLISVPARLIKTEAGLEIVNHGTNPFFRLMKSNVSIVMPMTEPYERPYQEFLSQSSMPEGLQQQTAETEALEEKLSKAAAAGNLIVPSWPKTH